jgi:arginine-tRNA-protein transferase
MVEETCVKTILTEYSVKEGSNKRVTAVSITDVIEDGLSMVYSFYEPNLPQLSLGKFMILDHISLTKEMNLPYLYLGYWVKGSKKMDYKAQYNPLEIFLNGKWSLLEDKIISKYYKEEPSSATDPVLNTIYLPDGDQ